MRRMWLFALMLAAGAVLAPGCKVLEPLEPRARDSFPLQAAKVAALVPATVVAIALGAVVVVGAAMANQSAQAIDHEAGPMGAPPGSLREIW